MTTLHRLLAAFLPRTPRAGERWLALTAVAWGAWLLLPMDTFEAGFGSTIGGKLLSETQWGVLAIALGAFSLIGTQCCRPRLRVVTCVLLTLFWAFLAAVIVPSGATSAILYLVLGLRQMTFVYDAVLTWRGG